MLNPKFDEVPDISKYKGDKVITEEEAYQNRIDLSVKDRLKLMWRKDAYGRYSPELQSVVNSALASSVIGFSIGFPKEKVKPFSVFVT